jgi:hypothetical protein
LFSLPTKSLQLYAGKRREPLIYGYPSLMVLVIRFVLHKYFYSVQDHPTRPAIDNARLLITNIFDEGICARPIAIQVRTMPML